MLSHGCSLPSNELKLLHLAVSDWVSEQLRSFLQRANGSWLTEPESPQPIDELFTPAERGELWLNVLKAYMESAVPRERPGDANPVPDE
jgi:hypothetical protein